MSSASGSTPPPPWLSTAASAIDLDAEVRVRKDAYNARLQQALGGGGIRPQPSSRHPSQAVQRVVDSSSVVGRTPSFSASPSPPAAGNVSSPLQCTCRGGKAMRPCCCDRLAAAVEAAKRRIELSRVRQHTHSLHESMMDTASASDAASTGAGASPSSSTAGSLAVPAVDTEAAVARAKLVAQVTDLESRRASSAVELKQLQRSVAVTAARRREELCTLEQRRHRAERGLRARTEVGPPSTIASETASTAADDESSSTSGAAAASTLAPAQPILTPLQMMREVQANMEHTEAMSELQRRIANELVKNERLEAQLMNTVERAKAAGIAHARRYHRH